MKKRFYLVSIQYNKVAEAENRTTPKAYDTEDEAVAQFHKQMGTDMTNKTLGWAISMVFDNFGRVIKQEVWEAPIASVEEASEETAEITE